MGRQRGSTREDLLDAGVRLFRMLPASFLRALSVGAVTQEAGFHRQTFYRYWDTQAEYVRDLSRRLLSTNAAPVADGLAVLPSRRSTPQDHRDLLGDVARYDFDRVAGDPSVMMRVGLLSMQALGEEPLADLMAAYYRTSIDTLTSALATLLAEWGRECVPPFTVRDLARVQQALLLGLVLQDKAAIDDPPATEVFQRSLTQIVMTFTSGIDVDMT